MTTFPYCGVCDRPITDEWWLTSRFGEKRHKSCDVAYQKGLKDADVLSKEEAPADDRGDPTKDESFDGSGC